jgi:hypothetical protein
LLDARGGNSPRRLSGQPEMLQTFPHIGEGSAIDDNLAHQRACMNAGKG